MFPFSSTNTSLLIKFPSKSLSSILILDKALLSGISFFPSTLIKLETIFSFSHSSTGSKSLTIVCSIVPNGINDSNICPIYLTLFLDIFL